MASHTAEPPNQEGDSKPLNFLDLPPELVIDIGNRLRNEDRVLLANTCKATRSLLDLEPDVQKRKQWLVSRERRVRHMELVSRDDYGRWACPRCVRMHHLHETDLPPTFDCDIHHHACVRNASATGHLGFYTLNTFMSGLQFQHIQIALRYQRLLSAGVETSHRMATESGVSLEPRQILTRALMPLGRTITHNYSLFVYDIESYHERRIIGDPNVIMPHTGKPQLRFVQHSTVDISQAQRNAGRQDRLDRAFFHICPHVSIVDRVYEARAEVLDKIPTPPEQIPVHTNPRDRYIIHVKVTPAVRHGIYGREQIINGLKQGRCKKCLTDYQFELLPNGSLRGHIWADFGTESVFYDAQEWSAQTGLSWTRKTFTRLYFPNGRPTRVPKVGIVNQFYYSDDDPEANPWGKSQAQQPETNLRGGLALEENDSPIYNTLAKPVIRWFTRVTLGRFLRFRGRNGQDLGH